MKQKVTEMDCVYDASLLEILDVAPIRPKGFGITVQEVVREKRVKKTTALAILEEKVAKGFWAKKFMRCGNGGRGTDVYYKP